MWKAKVYAEAIERKIFLSLVGMLCVTSLSAAPVCDVKAAVPATARAFARPDDQSGWREFRTMGNVPELQNDAGISGQFWKDEDGNSRAYMVEPGEDFWTFTRYCFNGAGQLQSVGYELRTAWDWGYELEGAVSGGKIHARTASFFSTVNNKSIGRPAGADDIPNALKPDLYLTVAKLPFARLLKPGNH